MMSRPTVVLELCVVLVILAVTACTRPTAAPPGPAAPAADVPGGALAGIAPAQPGNERVVLATTTSTQDSGLLDLLVPRFERVTGYQVKTVAVGTGQALALGARGEADVVLVHAPEAEMRWMAEGNGTARLLVMHNDFVLIGPPSDPAQISLAGSLPDVLQRIWTTGGAWISRDDDSGTDQLEKQLWREAGLDPKPQPWYVTTGQGMGATLTLADQKDGYTLSDRATYLARRGSLQSVVLFEGDTRLLNFYHVMPVNAAKFPGVPINADGGQAFAAFLTHPEIQQVIGDFGKDRYGQALFFPDAGRQEDEPS
jgi:tungstate transport system substrate-binding protein